ncbi:hypothetical protein L0U85_19060 [Glycomyces sp. L485]|uniref:hypothetical protein n=1 Tax=Glycomyces sp. L485 TaxID=2909235 RepID=UPI001F4A7EA1|nr:hypothetical protein [Glycomyces sp. L485]MCH7232935.1 hypothetical protein [Glycomyces sp. L485]
MGAVIAIIADFLTDAGANIADRTAPLTSWLAERLQPMASWTAERLQPWTALLADVTAVVATAVSERTRPVIRKLTERFGVRMTVIGTATAVIVGSTSGTAWAITALNDPADPASEQSWTVSAEDALFSDEATANAKAIIAAQQAEEAEAAAAAEAEAEAAEAAAAAEAAKQAEPEPVGDLSELQMDNAIAIVEAGDEAGLDRKAWAIALATAMQESKFRNYANVNVAESYNFEYQAEGSDHDSVGLFQQRPSSGWGSVEELMDPKTSANKFYGSLKKVNGWKDMPVTKAAQTVQVSAFPDAYAQWEGLAWDIVKSYEKAKS